MSEDRSTTHDVVVVGGGPAGSTAAAYLGMLGYDVLVLDKERFPRYRVGESLLPSMMPILEDFGLIDEVEALGFPRKTGGTFIWGKTREPWDVLFGTNPFLPYPYAYHVDRCVFDKFMLENAKNKGAKVIEQAEVMTPVIEDDRVVGVIWKDTDGHEHQASGKHIIDASGGVSILGRQLANREYDPKMRQVAFHTYYEDVLGPQNHRNGHVIVMSCSKGWFWYIPVDSAELGAASVGLVSGQEFKDEYNEMGTEAFFAQALEETEYLQELLGPKAKRTQPMSAITDWSYACDQMAGPGWFLAGDAAAFLDPLLSTGVTMAMLAGFSASACIHTAITDPSMEADATTFYDTNYQRMWTVTRDFLHYFYAGNSDAHPDDFFWEARSRLCLNENIGAQQAFCFMVNTIPGNPHPALEKQIHMFQQFMDNMEHPMEDMSCAFDGDYQEDKALVDPEGLSDDVVPMINGALATSWTIDKEGHRLVPVRGVAYDQTRAVFSSTSSWLLGGNIYPLPDDQCDLLALINGSDSWGDVLARQAEATGRDTAAVRDELTPLLHSLYEERFVLLRGEAANA